MKKAGMIGAIAAAANAQPTPKSLAVSGSYPAWQRPSFSPVSLRIAAISRFPGTGFFHSSSIPYRSARAFSLSTGSKGVYRITSPSEYI